MRVLGLGIVVGVCVLAVRGSAQQATPTAPQHAANFDSERKQADELYLAGKTLEALPLYEDLCKQDATIAVFAERHGMGLIKKSATLQDPKAQSEVMNEGMAEIRRAKSLGDDSPLVQTLLAQQAKTSPVGVAVGGALGALPLTVGYTYAGTSKAQAFAKDGEAAFAKNDFAAAEKLYEAASKADPAWYSAALFAGDANFRMKDWSDAGVWFAKAIAIDPDRETAYRYWGDDLYAAGDHMGSKAKIIEAVIAEPYTNTTWLKLRQWTQVTKTAFVVPGVNRPEFTTPDGKLKVDPALETETGDGHASWLVYQQERVAHGARTAGQPILAGATDKNGHQTPSGYVHTLDEEMAALTAMLGDLQKKLASGAVTQEKLEPGLKNLLLLQKMGFLEPFVLLNWNDAGLRYSYPAYRAGHREQLAAYVNKVVAPGVVQ